MSSTSDPHRHPASAPAPRKRRWILKAGATLFVLAGVAVGYIAWQVRSVPTHYRAHLAFMDTTSTDERKALAETALSKFDAVVSLASGGRYGTALTLDTNADLGRRSDTGEGSVLDDRSRKASTRHGAGDPADPSHQVDTHTVYTIEMSPEELNVLLDEELDMFMSRAGKALPGGVSRPMISSDDQGRFVTTFTLSAEGVQQVVSAYFTLRFMQSGEASLSVERYDAGNLPVPAGRIGEAIAERFEADQVREIGRFLADLEDYRFNPVLTASGDHQLQVVGFRIVEAGFAFDVRVIDGGKKPRLVARVDG
ncbi:MAG: hypothetical protein AAF586_08490 [Planctomycetota bacterium]